MAGEQSRDSGDQVPKELTEVAVDATADLAAGFYKRLAAKGLPDQIALPLTQTFLANMIAGSLRK